MSLVDARQLFLVPDIYLNSYSGATDTLDNANEQVGNVFQIYKAGNIRKIHFRTGTIDGDGNVITASIQTLSGGLPSGTLIDAEATGTVNVNNADDNKWMIVDFGESATVAVTQGQHVAVVLKATTWAANIRLSQGICPSQMLVHGNYQVLDNAGTGWAKGTAGRNNLIALEYTDGTFATSFPTASSFGTAVSVNTSSTPDEVGNYFQVPYPCRAVGIYVYGDLDYDAYLKLYDAAGNELANCTFESDNRQGTGGAVHYVYFDSDPAATYALAKDTWYRVAVSCTTTSNISIYREDLPSNAGMDGLALGTLCYATTRSDAGAWTNDADRRYNIGLIIDQLDNGVGSGGGGGLPIIGGSVVR